MLGMENLKRFEKSAEMLKALGNTKRLEIVCNLQSGEKNVGELEKIMGISQSALSQHLAVLRAADIVSTRRIAQSVYYSLTNPQCIKILDLLKNIYY